MRIVAGSAGGRHLKTFEHDDVRPTKDRVREAIFNSLGSYGEIDGRRFADLFAGSGALGLEALSRGAAHCLFVERDRRVADVVADNIDQLGFADRAVLRKADAAAVVESIEPVDVALLDPPYEFDGWDQLLGAVPARVVVIESDRVVDPGGGWRILKQKQYAGTVVVIAERADGGAAIQPSAGEEVDNP
jgi:16S rRNA (guanine966-N2)-methyltransferase